MCIGFWIFTYFLDAWIQIRRDVTQFSRDVTHLSRDIHPSNLSRHFMSRPNYVTSRTCHVTSALLVTPLYVTSQTTWCHAILSRDVTSKLRDVTLKVRDVTPNLYPSVQKVSENPKTYTHFTKYIQIYIYITINFKILGMGWLVYLR